MQGNVAELKRPEIDQPVKQVMAVRSGVTMVLGDNRQLTLETYFGQDDDDATVNALIDRILRIGDRAKARYDLEAEEEKFTTVGVTLGNLLAGIPHAERNAAVQVEELKSQIALIEIERESNKKAAYDEHAKAGRRGEFSLKGFHANKDDRFADEIAKKTEAIDKAGKDVAQNRQTVAKSVLHYQEDLKKRRAKINKMRSLCGMAPNEEFAAIETAKVEGLDD